MKPSKDMPRMAEAVSEAEEIFWNAIAARYPEARSGDLSPETSMAMSEAMRVAVTEWVKFNVDVDEDEIVGGDSTTILLHNVEYYYYDEPDKKLTDSDREQIAYQISQGTSEGDLTRTISVTTEKNDIKAIGYWGINN